MGPLRICQGSRQRISGKEQQKPNANDMETGVSVEEGEFQYGMGSIF